MAALGGAPLPRLTRLSLAECQLDGESTERLASGSTAASLLELDLSGDAMSASAARRRSPDRVSYAGCARRDRLLRELEAACDVLRRRVDERRELPADEWREWNGVPLATSATGAISVGTTVGGLIVI